MPTLTAVSTALPRYEITQSEIKSFAKKHFTGHIEDLDKLIELFDNTGIVKRYFTVPIDWFAEEHGFEEKNNLYIQSATDLGAEASKKIFEKANIKPSDIDYIIYINSTGLATPSIDARLINVLGLKKNIRRTPIWGLGCAGGAAGLSHAYHYLLGHPNHRVLVISVELCGLTFIPNDYTKSNLVATALFADGAGAMLVSGDEIASEGLNIVDTRSTFYPDSLQVMGWNVVTKGMQVVFDKRIPVLISQIAEEELTAFLSDHRLTKNDITEYLYHPGGWKVLEAYVKAYNLPEEKFRYSKDILRDFGNMSSSTVLYVLDRYLTERKAGKSDDLKNHLISALGPGFCSETLLVQW